MERRLFPITFVLMEAAWLCAIAVIWGEWLGADPDRPLLPVWSVAATLAAGLFAARRLLRAGSDSEGTGNRRALAVLIAAGWIWSLAVLWAVRHLGDEPSWFAGLSAAVERLLSGPSLDL